MQKTHCKNLLSRHCPYAGLAFVSSGKCHTNFTLPHMSHKNSDLSLCLTQGRRRERPACRSDKYRSNIALQYMSHKNF